MNTEKTFNVIYSIEPFHSKRRSSYKMDSSKTTKMQILKQPKKMYFDIFGCNRVNRPCIKNSSFHFVAENLLSLNNTLAQQAFIEDRIEKVIAGVQLEHAIHNLPEEKIAEYTNLLQQYYYQIVRGCVSYAQRHGVEQNNRCITNMYSFYVILWSLKNRLRLTNNQLYGMCYIASIT